MPIVKTNTVHIGILLATSHIRDLRTEDTH